MDLACFYQAHLSYFLYMAAASKQARSCSLETQGGIAMVEMEEITLGIVTSYNIYQDKNTNSQLWEILFCLAAKAEMATEAQALWLDGRGQSWSSSAGH